jgi:hypothetical protein
MPARFKANAIAPSACTLRSVSTIDLSSLVGNLPRRSVRPSTQFAMMTARPLDEQDHFVAIIGHVDDDLLDQHPRQFLLQAVRGTRMVPQPPHVFAQVGQLFTLRRCRLHGLMFVEGPDPRFLCRYARQSRLPLGSQPLTHRDVGHVGLLVFPSGAGLCFATCFQTIDEQLALLLILTRQVFRGTLRRRDARRADHFQDLLGQQRLELRAVKTQTAAAAAFPLSLPTVTDVAHATGLVVRLEGDSRSGGNATAPPSGFRRDLPALW